MAEPGTDTAETKRFFPVFLDLQGRLVVIVGSGKAAEKRARQFSRYGADITVISGRPSELLLSAEAEGALNVEQRGYVRGDLAGAFLALCVDSDPEVRRAVFAEAEALGCLVNVIDSPGLSNFILPGVVRKGRLELAVSTGGAAPEAAKALRRRLDDELGQEWAAWIELIAATRTLAAQRLSEDQVGHEAAIAHVTDSAIRDRLASGEAITAEQILSEAVPADETGVDTVTEP